MWVYESILSAFLVIVNDSLRCCCIHPVPDPTAEQIEFRLIDASLRARLYKSKRHHTRIQVCLWDNYSNAIFVLKEHGTQSPWIQMEEDGVLEHAWENVFTELLKCFDYVKMFSFTHNAVHGHELHNINCFDCV